MYSSIAFEETTLTLLNEQINSFFDEHEFVEIFSVNYQAFETNNYADHLYSCIIVFKPFVKKYVVE